MAEQNTETMVLESLRERVESQQEQLSDLVNNVPGIVWEIWFPETAGGNRVNFVNPYFERVTGYSAQRWLDDPNFWLGILHEGDRERIEAQLSVLLRSGSEGLFEFRWVSASGEPIDMEAHVTVVRGRDSGALGLRGVAMDVTHRKDLENTLQRQVDELASLTAALKRKNEELDQFAYVTSHDLKAPLRGIGNLSSWIEEDLGDDIPEQVGEHLRLLRSRVSRMQGMIDGILEYSRVDRSTPTASRVDVRELVGRIVDLLAPPPGFKVIVDDNLPVISTERARLERVFVALIQNAIKHHDRDEATIRISADTDGDVVRFSVSDDGPGVAAEYHAKVFQMFQTLQSKDVTENMGIGLTVAKKIVANHGGEIMLESSGRGTTVRFTWPTDQESNGVR